MAFDRKVSWILIKTTLLVLRGKETAVYGLLSNNNIFVLGKRHLLITLTIVPFPIRPYSNGSATFGKLRMVGLLGECI